MSIKYQHGFIMSSDKQSTTREELPTITLQEPLAQQRAQQQHLEQQAIIETETANRVEVMEVKLQRELDALYWEIQELMKPEARSIAARAAQTAATKFESQRVEKQKILEKELHAIFWQTQERMNAEAKLIAIQAAQKQSSLLMDQNPHVADSDNVSADVLSPPVSQNAAYEIPLTLSDDVLKADSPNQSDTESDDSDEKNSQDSDGTPSPLPQKSTAWKWSLAITGILSPVVFGAIAAVFIFAPFAAPFLPFFLAGLGGVFGALALAGIVAGGVLLIGTIVTIALACKKDAPKVDEDNLHSISECDDKNDQVSSPQDSPFHQLTANAKLSPEAPPAPPPSPDLLYRPAEVNVAASESKFSLE
jgi:hypothetical protein